MPDRSSPAAVPASFRLTLGRALAGVAIALGTLAGPAFVSVVRATSSEPAPPATTVPSTGSGTGSGTGSSDENDIGTNPFIPENANIGDCISALPGPDCGSKAQSGYHQYLIFVALILGLSFIGWRVGRSVRARDRETTPTAPRG